MTESFFYEVFYNRKTNQLTFVPERFSEGLEGRIGVFQSSQKLPPEERMIYFHMRSSVEEKFGAKIVYDEGKKPSESIKSCLGIYK